MAEVEEVDEGAVSDSALLSETPDEFFDKPNTETQFKTEQQPLDERNVCVVLSYLENDSSLVRDLMVKFHRMCASNQEMTDTHKVSLLVCVTDSNSLARLGYCDELTASNIVYRICETSGVKTEVYREYRTPLQRKITEEDLGKRPFRF